MSNWGYVGLAYGVVWAGLAGYWLYLSARRREAERIIEKEGGIR